jgi:hypothetical protein
MTSKKIKKATDNKKTKLLGAQVKKSKSTKITKPVKNKTASSLSFTTFIQEFTRALVITAIIILLTISFVIVKSQKKVTSVDNNSSNLAKNYLSILEDVNIINRGQNFFGNLNSSNISSSNSKEISLSQGSTISLGGIETINAPVGDKMISSEYRDIKYNYVYKGEDFSLFPDEINVYRRLTPDLSHELSDTITGKKISFFDLKKFSDLGINNMTIFEDKDYGYSLYLGLADSSFSIYKNWEKWPSSNNTVTCDSAGACYQENGLTIEEISNDEEILNISNQFLSDYEINLDNYGPGEVQKSWLKNYLLKSSYQYIPETITVIYPLKISGVAVYEESGNKTGLTVEVDMREKKVSGVYNLMYQYFESSTYNTEIDKEAIINLAEQGGLYNNYYTDSENVDEVEVNLDQPILGLVRVWQYSEKDSKSYELYVPAYIFPILSADSYPLLYKENIVVPAVKDFFDTESVNILNSEEVMVK